MHIVTKIIVVHLVGIFSDLRLLDETIIFFIIVLWLPVWCKVLLFFYYLSIAWCKSYWRGWYGYSLTELQIAGKVMNTYSQCTDFFYGDMLLGLLVSDKLNSE
jgi:hypothetical protein